MTAPSLAVLTRDQLAEADHAALAVGLAAPERRPVLLAGLPFALIAGLPAYATPTDQLWSDLDRLARLPRAPGLDGPPLAVWLDNAALLAAGRTEAATFTRLAAVAREVAPTLPDPPPLTAPASAAPRITSTVHEVNGGSIGVVHGNVVLNNAASAAPTPAAAPPDPLAPPTTALTLRPPKPPPPPRPETPYPLLDPIERPDALGGRDAELAQLLDRVARHRGLMGLFAPSGQGKSSLLLAGLVPRLRAEGIPVVLHRRPDMPNLGRALIDGLIAAPPVPPLPDDDPRPFAAWVDRLAADGPAPVIVLDQFEAVFKHGDDLAARARVGLLLAATVDPGRVRAPRCRWILAYREEFHGRVQRWLADVLQGAPSPKSTSVSLLRPARARPTRLCSASTSSTCLQHDSGVSPSAKPRGTHSRDPRDGNSRALRASWHGRLPHDLAPDDTLAAVAIPPLGSRDAIDAFADAIRRPVDASDGKWHFVDDGIDRLAEAFAATRDRRPDAPLVPELQVVLNRRVLAADDGAISVPDDVGGAIDDALRQHLVDTLRAAFAGHPEPVVARTMALLALRRLADAEGRRAEAGLPRAALWGLADDSVLDALAAWDARLIVPRGEGAHATVTLSHDRLAEVLLTVDDAEVFGAHAGFDARLIGLARLVGQRAAQYADTKDPATLSLRRDDYHAIAAHPVLLWDDDRRRWWGAVVERRRTRRRNGRLLALAALLLGVVALWVVGEVRRRDRIAEALALVQNSQSPEATLRGVQALLDNDAAPTVVDEAIDGAPLTAAEATPDEPVEAARARFIRRRLTGAAPAASAEDFGRLIAGVEAGAHPDAPNRLTAEQRRALRAEIRVALLTRFPAPAMSTGSMRTIEWVEVEGGSFEMGDERGGMADELPVHRVTLPGFELSRAEVTIGQYRAFDAEGYARNLRGQQAVANTTARWGDAAADYPAWMVNWHEAWAFALWADPEGRLPTEAEWEYATRGGVHAPSEAQLYWSGKTPDELVGWYDGNSGRQPHPVCSPPPNAARHPLGLCDAHGNLYEWVADVYTEGYPAGRADAPLGPRRGALRVNRGGCFVFDALSARSAFRSGYPPGIRNAFVGCRLARSAPSSSVESGL